MAACVAMLFERGGVSMITLESILLFQFSNVVYFILLVIIVLYHIG